MLDKYDTLNYQVLNMVAEVAFPNCTILDVGCWTGNLGEALKKRLNFAVTVDGLENNQDALKSVKGRGVYTKIYELDLNNSSLPLKGQYNIIVFADVLEHLINPEKTLQEILKHLSPNGWVVVSLPKIAFIKYRLLHLLGKWDYRNSRIMDKTHLHFYTLDTMRTLFKTCGLEVVDQQALVAVPRIMPRLFAWQFVFKLTPAKEK